MAEKILRTPDERFANLPGYDFEPHYIQVGDTRIHYIEQGKGDPILCLHGEPSWSYLYRKMIPLLSAAGRAMAMDLVGFGRSDKYADPKAYNMKMHYDTLAAFIEQLDLRNITLVVQDWGGLIGLSYAAVHPDRFKGLVIMNTGLPSGFRSGSYFKQLKKGFPFLLWQTYSRFVPNFRVGKIVASGCAQWVTDDIKAAYDAPFPHDNYKAGARVFPALVPTFSDKHPTAAYTARAKEKLRSWDKPVLIMFSDKDPITRGQHHVFEHLIPTADQDKTIIIKDAGHFLQEDKGEEIAGHILDWLKGMKN
jgi:haloalkane dehalogenase